MILVTILGLFHRINLPDFPSAMIKYKKDKVKEEEKLFEKPGKVYYKKKIQKFVTSLEYKRKWWNYYCNWILKKFIKMLVDF